MRARAFSRILAAVLSVAPAVAAATDLSARLSLLYDRTERDYAGPGLIDRTEWLNFEGSLAGSGYIVAPGSFDWRGRAEYRQIDFSRTEGTQRTHWLDFDGNLGVLQRPESPVHLLLHARQSLTDFSSEVSTQTTPGSTRARTLDGMLRWDPPGRPSYWFGGGYMEAVDTRFELPDATRNAWTVDAGTRHGTSAFQYTARYTGMYSEGAYPSDNYNDHSAEVSASSALNSRTWVGVSEAYRLREPTLAAATNPASENNRFIAYLRTSPRVGVTERVDYRYQRSLIDSSVRGTDERTRQQVGITDDRVHSPEWRTITSLTASYNQDRAATRLTSTTGQTLGAQAVWTGQTAGRVLTFGAGPTLGAIEAPGGYFALAYGASANGSVDWTRGLSHAGLGYGGSYASNTEGALGWSFGQSATAWAETVGGSGVRTSGRLTASSQRQYAPTFGDSAVRSLRLDAATAYRGYSLTAIGTYASGAVGPLSDSGLRGDGLLVPFPFNSRTVYGDLTGRAPLTRRLSLFARGAYSEQVTAEIPAGSERVAAAGAEYSVGAMWLSVEGRYTQASSNGQRFDETRVFARLSRGFGTRF